MPADNGASAQTPHQNQNQHQQHPAASALRATAPVFMPASAGGAGAAAAGGTAGGTAGGAAGGTAGGAAGGATGGAAQLPRRASATAQHHGSFARGSHGGSAGNSGNIGNNNGLPRGHSFHGRTPGSSSRPVGAGAGAGAGAGDGAGDPSFSPAAGGGDGGGGGAGHHPRGAKMAPTEAYRMRHARASRSFVAKKRGDAHGPAEHFQLARAAPLSNTRVTAAPLGERPGEHPAADNSSGAQPHIRGEQGAHQPPAVVGHLDLLEHNAGDQGRPFKNNRKRSATYYKSRNTNAPYHQRGHAHTPSDPLSLSLSDTSSNPDHRPAHHGSDFDVADPVARQPAADAPEDGGVGTAAARGHLNPSAAAVFAARNPPDAASEEGDGANAEELRARDPFESSIPRKRGAADRSTAPSLPDGNTTTSTAPASRPSHAGKPAAAILGGPSDDARDERVNSADDPLATPAPRPRSATSSRDSPTLSLVSAPTCDADSPERGQTEDDDALCDEPTAVKASNVNAGALDGPHPGHTHEQPEKSSVSSPDGFQAMPESGKWCQECAGLGLHIAALVAQMQLGKSQQAVDAAENAAKEKEAAAAAEKKSSWKRTVSAAVLGSSSSSTEAAKVKAEKVRLEEENAVLRATIEYLYQKVESLSPPPAVAERFRVS